MNTAGGFTGARPRRTRPIRSIRIHAGQGDVLMAVTGLQALRELGVPFLAPDACVYTRTDTESLIRALLPDLKVVSLQNSKHVPHPRYVIVQRTSLSTVLRNWLYPDYYVNFPERRLITSFGYPTPGIVHRLLMWLSDIKLGMPTDRRRETPAYYALRIWAPLAARWGVTDTALTGALYDAHRTLRQRLLDYAAQLQARQPRELPRVAIFPSGRGFQYVPPAFVQQLVTASGLGVGDYTCYFGAKDPTRADYEKLGLRCDVSSDPESALLAVSSAAVTLTSDSFVSHLAQLAAREHIALMSHDLPPHTMNPAATSRVVFEPQRCCPCYYTTREPGVTCQAGRDSCGVFVMPRYLDRAVAAVRQALAAG